MRRNSIREDGIGAAPCFCYSSPDNAPTRAGRSSGSARIREAVPFRPSYVQECSLGINQARTSAWSRRPNLGSNSNKVSTHDGADGSFFVTERTKLSANLRQHVRSQEGCLD